jgi:hypothetical protein
VVGTRATAHPRWGATASNSGRSVREILRARDTGCLFGFLRARRRTTRPPRRAHATTTYTSGSPSPPSNHRVLDPHRDKSQGGTGVTPPGPASGAGLSDAASVEAILARARLVGEDRRVAGHTG